MCLIETAVVAEVGTAVAAAEAVTLAETLAMMNAGLGAAQSATAMQTFLTFMGENALAIQSGMAVVNAVGAEYSAYQSEKAGNEAMADNARIASLDAAAQYTAQQLKLVQEEEKAAIEIEQVAFRTSQAIGAGVVGAVESGVGGGSVAEKLASFRSSEANYQRNILRSQDLARAASVSNSLSVQRRAKNNIATFNPNSDSPSLLRFGLSIGTGLMFAQSKFAVPGVG